MSAFNRMRAGAAERPRAKSDKNMLPMLTIAEQRRAPHYRLNCGRYSVYEDNDFGRPTLIRPISSTFRSDSRGFLAEFR
jgi:hypothetical protein